MDKTTKRNIIALGSCLVIASVVTGANFWSRLYFPAVSTLFDRSDFSLPREELKYSQFIQELEEGKISRATMSRDTQTFVITRNDGSRAFVNPVPSTKDSSGESRLKRDMDLIRLFVDHDVDVEVSPIKR